WIRPGATVIDVGTNKVTDPAEAARLLRNFPERLEKFRAKGNVLLGDVHPDADEQHGESRALAASSRRCGWRALAVSAAPRLRFCRHTLRGGLYDRQWRVP